MFQSLFGFRSATNVKQINSFDLSDMIQKDGNVLLVDVRSPHEYQIDGHIAGARLLPLQTLTQRLNELPKDKTIVCVCRSGNRSLVACEQLSHAGFENVINFRDGMIGWKQAGFPYQ